MGLSIGSSNFLLRGGLQRRAQEVGRGGWQRGQSCPGLPDGVSLGEPGWCQPMAEMPIILVISTLWTMGGEQSSLGTLLSSWGLCLGPLRLLTGVTGVVIKANAMCRWTQAQSKWSGSNSMATGGMGEQWDPRHTHQMPSTFKHRPNT